MHSWKWTYGSRTRAMVYSYLASNARCTGWLSTNNKPQWPCSAFKITCVSTWTQQTKARAWSQLTRPHLVDDALPGSLSMNQGWESGGIGNNTQILALISGHLHKGCQSKLQQQGVHSVGKDINILMEINSAMTLKILHRRNYGATIMATDTLSRRGWNILRGIISVGSVGGKNSWYSNGTTSGSTLCRISVCTGCITHLGLGEAAWLVLMSLPYPLKLSGRQNLRG